MMKMHSPVLTEHFSSLMLGTVQLGIPYGIANDTGLPSHQMRHSILSTAVEKGITCFDTASNYGTAESVLGGFFNKQGYVYPFSTKFHISDDCKNYHEIESQIRIQVNASLKSLQVEVIPVYLFHQSINQQDPLLLQLIANVLETLIKEGLVLKGGISVYFPAFAAKAIELDVFECIQIPFSILDHRLLHNNLLYDLTNKKKLVFVRSVYLQGLLFKSHETLTGNMRMAIPYLRNLNEIEQSTGIKMAQLAISFVKSFPGITSVVIGAETASQVSELATLISSPPLEVNLLQQILTLFNQVPEEIIVPAYWKP